MASFSVAQERSVPSLSTLPAIANRVKHMTMGLGVFLLIFAVSMPLLIGVYTLSILLAAVFFLMGIFAVVAGSRIKARPNSGSSSYSKRSHRSQMQILQRVES